MTNRQETKDRQYVARLSHFRSLLRRQFGFLAFAPLVLTSSLRGCDDMRPATITCQDIVLHVEPGTCVSFSNPCSASGRWAGRPDYDGFRLEPSEEILGSIAAARVTLLTTRNGDETTRSICVRADSPLFPSLEIDYVYGLRVQYGVAGLFLSVTTPLTVEVSASPTNPTLGESSQLVATARGGIPPYFYAWVPTTTLNDTDIAAPIATPTETTRYRVRVTDSAGQETISDFITISVGTELTVTAYPPEIGIGDVAVLLVTAQGGKPPHTYAWTPADSTLDDPYSSHPSAAPTTTTTYHVTVFDKDGDTVGSRSVTVKVRLEVAVTAQSQNILAGQSTALLAAVRGGTEPYTYTWTPTDTLDDPQRKDPIAAPTMTTTYHVLARDAVGDATAGEVTVQVIDDVPPPTASFVMGIACCPSITLDASASTGNIVTYTWDLGWTSGTPDRNTSSPTTSFPINEFDRGLITLTVTAADGQTATATLNF